MFYGPFYGPFAYSSQCRDLLVLKKESTSLSFAHSLNTYEELKKHPMWAHQSPAFRSHLIDFFLDQSLEQSGDILFKVMLDLKTSRKLSLLKEARSILTPPAASINTGTFLEMSEALEKKFNIVLDFGLDTTPRLRRFVSSAQVSIRSIKDLERHIEWVEREREHLVSLFEAVSQTADESVKTFRYIDYSTLEIKPSPEKITLLAYTIRHQHLDLFELLVNSPQILGQLHLDYTVLLLDEVELLPSDIRSPYRRLANKTFSPIALEQYNRGLRGSDGSTLWDKIPIQWY